MYYLLVIFTAYDSNIINAKVLSWSQCYPTSIGSTCYDINMILSFICDSSIQKSWFQ